MRLLAIFQLVIVLSGCALPDYDSIRRDNSSEWFRCVFMEDRSCC